MRRANASFVVVLLAGLTALPATASLIGDSIDGSLYNIVDGGIVTELFDSPAIVGAGSEFMGTWGFPPVTTPFSFLVDVSESTVTVDVISTDADANISTSGDGLVGITLSGLDWVDDPDAIITGLTVTSGNPDIFETLAFGDHSITIEWDSLGVFNDNETLESWTFAITTSGHADPVVPEPATMVLLGIGLSGAIYRIRRR